MYDAKFFNHSRFACFPWDLTVHSIWFNYLFSFSLMISFSSPCICYYTPRRAPMFSVGKRKNEHSHIFRWREPVMIQGTKRIAFFCPCVYVCVCLYICVCRSVRSVCCRGTLFSAQAFALLCVERSLLTDLGDRMESLESNPDQLHAS